MCWRALHSNTLSSSSNIMQPKIDEKEVLYIFQSLFIDD